MDARKEKSLADYVDPRKIRCSIENEKIVQCKNTGMVCTRTVRIMTGSRSSSFTL
jgi:hypothetical protein